MEYVSIQLSHCSYLDLSLLSMGRDECSVWMYFCYCGLKNCVRKCENASVLKCAIVKHGRFRLFWERSVSKSF